jgi:hypothetical protein
MMVDDGEESQLKGPIDILAPYTCEQHMSGLIAPCDQHSQLASEIDMECAVREDAARPV